MNNDKADKDKLPNKGDTWGHFFINILSCTTVYLYIVALNGSPGFSIMFLLYLLTSLIIGTLISSVIFAILQYECGSSYNQARTRKQFWVYALLGSTILIAAVALSLWIKHEVI